MVYLSVCPSPPSLLHQPSGYQPSISSGPPHTHPLSVPSSGPLQQHLAPNDRKVLSSPGFSSAVLGSCDHFRALFSGNCVFSHFPFPRFIYTLHLPGGRCSGVRAAHSLAGRLAWGRMEPVTAAGSSISAVAPPALLLAPGATAALCSSWTRLTLRPLQDAGIANGDQRGELGASQIAARLCGSPR